MLKEILQVNAPGTNGRGCWRLTCSGFFSERCTAQVFKRLIKTLKQDPENLQENARAVYDWAAAQGSDFMQKHASRLAEINALFSDYQETPESAKISAAIDGLEKINKKEKLGHKTIVETRENALFICNNFICVKYERAADFENLAAMEKKTGNNYEKIFAGFNDKNGLFSQVLPDEKTLKTQGKTRGAKQHAYFVTAKGAAYNLNYLQYAASVTGSRKIYFTAEGPAVYMAGNGFIISFYRVGNGVFNGHHNEIVITEKTKTLSGIKVLYAYPCDADPLQVVRCRMEYTTGNTNSTYHPDKASALAYAAKTAASYPGLVSGISLRCGTLAGCISWNDETETSFSESELLTEGAAVPAGKEFSNYETGRASSDNQNPGNPETVSDIPAARAADQDQNQNQQEPEPAAARLYKIGGLEYTAAELENIISSSLYLLKDAAVYAIEKTARGGFKSIKIYEINEHAEKVARGGYCWVSYETLKNFFPWFPGPYYQAGRADADQQAEATPAAAETETGSQASPLADHNASASPAALKPVNTASPLETGPDPAEKPAVIITEYRQIQEAETGHAENRAKTAVYATKDGRPIKYPYQTENTAGTAQNRPKTENPAGLPAGIPGTVKTCRHGIKQGTMASPLPINRQGTGPPEKYRHKNGTRAGPEPFLRPSALSAPSVAFGKLE